MTAGWTHHHVAIGINQPPPIMRADAWTTGMRHQGAARFWAVHHRDDHLLVLRASIPLRTGTPDPQPIAVKRAADWWRKRLMFVTLGPDLPWPAWTWTEETP